MFFEYSFGSPRDRPKILDFIFVIRLFLVRFESVDVRIPRVLSIFHKICMGAHNHPPKLGYGGCNSKIHYKIFKIRNISLDFILKIRQNTDFFSPQDLFVKLDFLVLPLTSKKCALASLRASDFSVCQQDGIFPK